MNVYSQTNTENLKNEREKLLKKYSDFKSQNLKLDMSRGKPCTEQLELSSQLLDTVTSKSKYKTESGIDCRNYGILDGIPEIKKLFSELLGVSHENVMIGGNSSLNMMFDVLSCLVTHGISGCTPWCKQKKIKFLCPVPGYDRHFAILDYFGIEPINVAMLKTGPDMEVVEKIVSQDESVKGIWCVPKYSNPQGITYSDETVRRFARLRPKADDFKIFWDNAYAIHGLTEHDDQLLNLMEECKKTKNEDLPIIFCSTSKMTFPGAGIAAMGTSQNNLKVFKKQYSAQTIGFDKINQLRHLLYFKNLDGIKAHMKKHAAIIKPKFDIVISSLERELSDLDVCSWTYPSGGYFVSVDVLPGCAKGVVKLCKDAGVVMTPAGATYPHGYDPTDSNIRIAPTYPSLDELKQAMDLFCTTVKLTAINKILSEDK